LDIDPGGMVVIFFSKSSKKYGKKISKRNNLKKGKKLGVGQKYNNRKKRMRF
jgi:hypothetical protein